MCIPRSDASSSVCAMRVWRISTRVKFAGCTRLARFARQNATWLCLQMLQMRCLGAAGGEERSPNVGPQNEGGPNAAVGGDHRGLATKTQSAAEEGATERQRRCQKRRKESGERERRREGKGSGRKRRLTTGEKREVERECVWWAKSRGKGRAESRAGVDERRGGAERLWKREWREARRQATQRQRRSAERKGEGRVGSCWVGSCWVGLGRAGLGRVGSGRVGS